jgi:hypothetical protein
MRRLPSSETVVGLQFNHPSDAVRLLLLDAIVVIGLDCQAESDLGIDALRGISALRGVAPIAAVFAPAAVAATAFILAPVVLGPFIPHVPQMFASAFIAILAIHTLFMHVFASAISPVLLCASEWSGYRDGHPSDNQQPYFHDLSSSGREQANRAAKSAATPFH